MAEATTWGVSVEDVSALAPHIVIANDPGPAPDPAPLGDPYNKTTIRKVTRSQVEAFIADITAAVDLRLHLRSRVLDQSYLARLDALAQDTITNGAAWYLVAAAFPVKAGTNENTNYSAELKARYKESLDALDASLVAFIKVGVGVEPLSSVPASIRPNFHAPIFPDDMRF
jgi:hypothetical protein